MNKVRCIVVDDESIARRIIVNYLGELEGYSVVAQCKNALEAMHVLNSENIDLIFLDIEMPKIKGLDFLKTLSNPPEVIITTAHREYALEGFELEVLDYLLKPISFERFLKSLNKFKRTYSSNSEINQETEIVDLLYVKSERKTLKLNQSEITHIESLNNYVIIHYKGNKHIVYTSMTELLKELKEYFVRIHKSYTVNTKKIKSFSKEEVSLGRISLPIGKTYKEVIALL